VNIGVGMAAMFLRPPGACFPSPYSAEKEDWARESPSASFHSRLALSAFFLTGLLSMVYENAWTRALVLVFGTSIYAFATMLTTYLLGLGLGSLLSSWLADRVKKPVFAYSTLLTAVGVSVLVTTPVLGSLPGFFLEVFGGQDRSWEYITFLEFAVSFLVMIVPTLCNGAAFPLVAHILAQTRPVQIGRAVADAYAFNTAGCIFGSLATGFLLIPWLGVEKPSCGRSHEHGPGSGIVAPAERDSENMGSNRDTGGLDGLGHCRFPRFSLLGQKGHDLGGLHLCPLHCQGCGDKR